jgi:hypothetical protein
MAFVLLKCIAKAAIKNVGNLFGFGVGGSVLVDAWEYWEKEAAKQPDHVEIEATAQAGRDVVTSEVTALLAAEAPELPEAERREVISFV